MNKFYREDRKGGNDRRGGFRGGSKFGGSKFGGKKEFGFKKDRGFKKEGGFGEVFDANCDKCGNSCKVPFRPAEGKPVYCKWCFRKDEGGHKGKSFAKPYGKPSYESRPHASTGAAPDLSKIEARLTSIEEKLNALLDAWTEAAEEAEEPGENE